MVAPVTGPIVETQSGQFTSLQRNRYRQGMPIDRPLPYYMTLHEGMDRQTNSESAYDSGFIKNVSWSASGNMSDFSRRYQHCYNQAYEALRANASDRAGWGENLAQFGKSAEMVSDRLVQLSRFTQHLRRGNFSKAASVLEIPKPRKASHRKNLAGNYLEYSYGWAPLFSDIQSSMKILTSDPGERRIRGKGREWWADVYRDNGSDSLGSWSTRLDQHCNLQVTARAIVRVTNPNLFLANSLGLIDPALPWKLVPFSFVVDWFVNVEQVMASMTTWLGAELTHPHYTVFSKGRKKYYSVTHYKVGDLVHTTTGSSDISEVAVSRVIGLPSPTLVIRPFKGFSLSRGLQAISLIVSVLGK